MNGTVNPNDSHTAPRPLDVIIVGAGIGGLTAAIALRRQGHNVTLFEASNFASEVGAAINVVPNATSVLLKLGIDVVESGAVLLERMMFMKWNGEIIENRDMLHGAGRWRAAWLLTHRAALHQHLKDTALSAKGEGRPVTLKCGHKASTIDAETATVTFSNGSTAHGDILIGADGVHSMTRSAINPNVQARRTKHSCFRFLATRKAALQDPRTAEFFSTNGSLDMWFREEYKAVIYPCANNEIINVAGVHPAELSGASHYNSAASKSQMLDIFKDFDPTLVAMLEQADLEELKVYPLFDMDPLGTFVRGRLALVGDAGHPMLPQMAQGGAQAIEDGVSLGVMLSAGVLPEEVPQRLKLYNQARYKRATRVQRYARGVSSDTLKEEDTNLDKFNFHEATEYCLDHDEFDASSDLLRRWQWSCDPDLCLRDLVRKETIRRESVDDWKEDSRLHEVAQATH